MQLPHLASQANLVARIEIHRRKKKKSLVIEASSIGRGIPILIVYACIWDGTVLSCSLRAHRVVGIS